jgi:zinc/manganese transport system substrate-binding protein
MNRRGVLAWAGAVGTATSWPVAAQDKAAAPPRIVASFSILADMAVQLAPQGAEVSALVGPNSDAHTFEPKPADGKRLAQADLIIVNGLGYEGWIERLVRVSGSKALVVVASEGIKTLQVSAGYEAGSEQAQGHKHSHNKANSADPHAWQDLAQAQRYVANISAAFARRWPAQQAALRTRRDTYLAQMTTLDAQVRSSLGQVPREQRRVITSHDAFGYFGAAYGVDFLSPQGWSTDSEPSAAAVARLIRQIRQDRARAVFVENISNRRLIERIAAEAGAQVGGTLYSDALSAPGGPASTYLQMFEHNARTLVRALVQTPAHTSAQTSAQTPAPLKGK